MRLDDERLRRTRVYAELLRRTEGETVLDSVGDGPEGLQQVELTPEQFQRWYRRGHGRGGLEDNEVVHRMLLDSDGELLADLRATPWPCNVFRLGLRHDMPEDQQAQHRSSLFGVYSPVQPTAAAALRSSCSAPIHMAEWDGEASSPSTCAVDLALQASCPDLELSPAGHFELGSGCGSQRISDGGSSMAGSAAAHGPSAEQHDSWSMSEDSLRQTDEPCLSSQASIGSCCLDHQPQANEAAGRARSVASSMVLVSSTPLSPASSLHSEEISCSWQACSRSWEQPTGGQTAGLAPDAAGMQGPAASLQEAETQDQARSSGPASSRCSFDEVTAPGPDARPQVLLVLAPADAELFDVFTQVEATDEACCSSRRTSSSDSGWIECQVFAGGDTETTELTEPCAARAPAAVDGVPVIGCPELGAEVCSTPASDDGSSALQSQQTAEEPAAVAATAAAVQPSHDTEEEVLATVDFPASDGQADFSAWPPESQADLVAAVDGLQASFTCLEPPYEAISIVTVDEAQMHAEGTACSTDAPVAHEVTPEPQVEDLARSSGDAEALHQVCPAPEDSSSGSSSNAAEVLHNACPALEDSSSSRITAAEALHQACNASQDSKSTSTAAAEASLSAEEPEPRYRKVVCLRQETAPSADSFISLQLPSQKLPQAPKAAGAANQKVPSSSKQQADRNRRLAPLPQAEFRPKAAAAVTAPHAQNCSRDGPAAEVEGDTWMVQGRRARRRAHQPEHVVANVLKVAAQPAAQPMAQAGKAVPKAPADKPSSGGPARNQAKPRASPRKSGRGRACSQIPVACDQLTLAAQQQHASAHRPPLAMLIAISVAVLAVLLGAILAFGGSPIVSLVYKN